MDKYLQRLQKEGLIGSTGATNMVLDLPLAPMILHSDNIALTVGDAGILRSDSVAPMMGDAGILRSDSVAPTMGDAELKGELKKLNKHLRQMIDVKKQANLIAAGFYLCIVALGLA